MGLNISIMPIADARTYRDKYLKCPFCLMPLTRIWDVKNPIGGTVSGGTCECGAVYVQDRSGRNLGEAYSEALAMAYDWDYDAAYRTDGPGFEDAVVRYDSRMGKFMLGDGGPMDRSGKFVFIKRKTE